MKIIMLPYFITLFFVSCNDGRKSNTNNPASGSNLKEMIVEKKDDNWGGDIILNIERADKISSEITAYRIISFYKGQPVGFNMILKQPTKKNMFITKGVTFLSLKDTSNNFLKALAEIYGVKFTNAEFKDSITISYADLTFGADLNKPGNWIAAQKKLFFETDDDNPELFLNIDEIAGRISLPEKDRNYREGIIYALSKK